HYFENKIRVQLILDKHGVPVPNAIFFVHKYDPNSRIVTSRASHANRIRKFISYFGPSVLKPAASSGGQDVLFVNENNIDAAAGMVMRWLHDGHPSLLQSQVVPPYVNERGKQLDWNLRVFVAWDIVRQQPVVSDMVVRIDEAGGAVNICRTAKVCTL